MYLFDKYTFILASSSPRRRELLKGLGLRLQVVDKFHVCESYPKNLPKEEIAGYLANIKADSCPHRLLDNEILIAADTIVVCDNIIFGKPKTCEDAKDMLERLSGREHKVITGVTVVFNGKTYTFSETSTVNFNELSIDEIDHYIDEYKPFDKAGSYAIQEWIGFIGIKSINGCYYNIMGLPLQKLYTLLKKIL
ncbi:MAG: septum formation protein Maf [Bacteroidetes bacterium]|nr:septum formation protein Maf [Bacteroidota bacterium]